MSWETDGVGVQLRLTSSKPLNQDEEVFNHYGNKGNEVGSSLAVSLVASLLGFANKMW